MHVWLLSEPRYLGALLVAPDGTYDGTFPLADVEIGGHTLQANGISADDVPRSANLGIVVVDPVMPEPSPVELPRTGGRGWVLTTWAWLLGGLGLMVVGVRRRIESLVR